MTSIPPGANPYNEDVYHMGFRVGSNVVIMFDCLDHQNCKYLIVVNTETGHRLKVEMPAKKQYATV